jgi:hypothetical protein
MMNDTHYVNLFLVNRASEAIGQFLDSDFALLEMKAPILKEEKLLVKT